MVSTSEEEGVIGYQVTTVQPANIAPSAQAALPSMMILPAVSFIRSTWKRSGSVKVLAAYSKTAWQGPPFRLGGLGLLLAELFDQRLADLRHFDGEKFGDHAVVNHVADQLPQFGVGAHRRHQLIERDGEEVHIAAQLVELQRRVVDNGGAAVELHDILARGFGVHGHQEIDFLAAPDVPVLADADGEPGGQTRDVRREHVLPGNRDAHLEDGPHEDGVGGLATRPVNGCYLNAEIVGYRMGWLFRQRVRRRYF